MELILFKSETEKLFVEDAHLSELLSCLFLKLRNRWLGVDGIEILQNSKFDNNWS